ncbi:MAG: hypothetical protein NWE89_14610 [Candidatus Bathyarchaeota archaeon]|nr:hypothetical protein [Candidatus Bathyarchaeota archaeon]
MITPEPRDTPMMSRAEATRITVAVFTVVALTYGRTVTYPDNVHVIHGVPFRWGVHQLVTIAGPVDQWTVNVTLLALDIAIWMLILLIAPILARRFSAE